MEMEGEVCKIQSLGWLVFDHLRRGERKLLRKNMEVLTRAPRNKKGLF